MKTFDTRIEPEQAAVEFFRERYHGARVLFLAGSVLRGEGTPTSDLDVVVVYDQLPNPYREAFVHRGWPVEAFVHDSETLNYFISEREGRSGVPSLARMVVEGHEVPGPSACSTSLKRLAAKVIAAGPASWSEDETRQMRYRLTDIVDDIRHPCSDEELIACGAQLYEWVADFYFRSQKLWSARRKAIPLRLRVIDPDFAARFVQAFEQLFVTKRPELVIALVEEVLRPCGGFLFDGYRQDAPPDCRRPIKADDE